MVRGATAILCAALSVGSVIHARSAGACSAVPPSGIDSRSTFPAEGAVGLPRNVQIRVGYHGPRGAVRSLPAAQLGLRVVGGEDVAVVETWPGDGIVLTPREPLEASTRYEILDTIGVPCTAEEYETTRCIGEPNVVAAFETGTTVDETAPSFAGLDALESSYYELPDVFCDDDRPLQAVSIRPSWTAAVDDGPVEGIRYNIYGDGMLLLQVGGPGASGRAYCSAPAPVSNLAPPDFVGPHGDYLVRAIDGSGNEDANEVSFPTAMCSGFGIDDGAADGRYEGGCAAGGATGSALGLLVVVLALAVRRVSRRRRG